MQISPKTQPAWRVPLRVPHSGARSVLGLRRPDLRPCLSTCRPGIKSRHNDSRNSPVVHCVGRIYAHPEDRLRQTDKYSRRQCYSPEGDSFSVVRLTLVVPRRGSGMSSDRARRPVPVMPNQSTNSTVWYGGQLLEDIDCWQDQIK